MGNNGNQSVCSEENAILLRTTTSSKPAKKDVSHQENKRNASYSMVSLGDEGMVKS